MFDPPPLGAAFGFGEDLGLEGGMELAAEEVQHVSGGQVQAGVADRAMLQSIRD